MMYIKYSSVENSAYGFERVLAFVTIHPWEIVNGQLTNERVRFDLLCYKCVYLYDISPR